MEISSLIHWLAKHGTKCYHPKEILIVKYLILKYQSSPTSTSQYFSNSAVIFIRVVVIFRAVFTACRRQKNRWGQKERLTLSWFGRCCENIWMWLKKTCGYSAEGSLLVFVNKSLGEHAEEKWAYSATEIFCRRLSSVYRVLAFLFIFLSIGFCNLYIWEERWGLIILFLEKLSLYLI